MKKERTIEMDEHEADKFCLMEGDVYDDSAPVEPQTVRNAKSAPMIQMQCLLKQALLIWTGFSRAKEECAGSCCWHTTAADFGACPCRIAG